MSAADGEGRSGERRCGWCCWECWECCEYESSRTVSSEVAEPAVGRRVSWLWKRLRLTLLAADDAVGISLSSLSRSLPPAPPPLALDMFGAMARDEDGWRSVMVYEAGDSRLICPSTINK